MTQPGGTGGIQPESYPEGAVEESEPVKAPPPRSDQPNSAVLALRQKADSHVEQENFGAAAASLERAIRISPRDADLYFSLARVRLMQENSPQAGQLCNKAVSYASDRRFMELKCEALLAPD